ncbi:hypothetical protein [uncultured Tateyamaria sp.]|uniref:hypothetical protein n=1 Tax=uncultured Tateyamaria sp. TaxID=455651 RepID=UPI002613CCF5|nr:hypothetical protein [uncultured Tateyamaria sp.]
MRLVLALALAVWAGPLAAQDGVACLQSQLSALGHDPGPVDGTMRPSVRDAAAAWGGGDAFPGLRRGTATSWCREIGLSDPALKSHWPSAKPLIIAAETPIATALLRQSFEAIQTYFRDIQGIELATRVAVIGAGEGGFFDPALVDVLMQLERPARARPIDTARLCNGRTVGGAANRPYMLFCWPQTVEDPAWQARIAPELRRVMAHEYTHQVQYALAADDPAQRVDGVWRLGPHWMVEGVAELVEWQFVSGQQTTDGADLFDLQTAARRSRLTLDGLDAQGTVTDSEAYGVARFAAYLLAQRHGTDALFDYFRALGRGLSQDDAFAQTFGLTPAAYTALFEELRRDYGAARRFGRRDP